MSRRRLLLAGRMRYAMPLSPSLARKFDALEREVDVRVLGSRGAVAGRRDARFSLVPPFPVRALDGAAFYALFPFRLARVLRRERPDVVLVQGAQETGLALLGRRLAGSSARIVADVHGDPGAATRLYGSPLRRLLDAPGDALARHAIRHADGVRTISGYTTGLVRGLGVEPAAEFPAFMDLDPFLDRPVVPLPDRPVVLFVGVLERYKAVDVLAEAWAQVARRVPAAELHLVGRGTLADVAEALVREHPGVRWTPALSTDEVARALDAASVLVLPSRSEGLGRVVVEAFCRGRGVVGSRVGGIPDIVEDGVSGLLVEPGDAVGLAEALERVVTDAPLVARLGQGAHAAAPGWCASPEEYAAHVRALVERVCEGA